MTAFLALAAFLLALLLALRWFERANLYIPDRELTALPASYGWEHAEADFEASDGTRLHGWLVPAPSADAPLLVFFHGNAGNISHRLEKVKLFRDAGLSVFLFDYRGYGRSSGRPSEEGTYQDGLGALEHLARERGLAAEGLVYYGESLGAAVALETALRRPPAALILDSAFTSTAEMGRLILPWLPAGRLLRYRYDNVGKIGRLRRPLLVLHSPDDDIVPFAMGRRLYEAAPEPKEFFELRGGHNDGFLETPGYGEAVARFARRALRRAKAAS